MNDFYKLLDKIKDSLRSNPNVNTVTFGNLMDLDLNKTSMFPLSHMVVSDVRFSERVMTASIEILCVDVVDDNRGENQFDDFYSNDNMMDVMNTQLAVGNLLQSEMRRGQLFTDKFQVLTDVSARPFYDRFENQLAGWGFTFIIEIPNNNTSIC
jgi:hypothetical protein